MEEVKRCIGKSFKETYLMFKDWSVLYVHGLRFGGRKSRLMPVEPDVIVKVKGKDIHNEPEYRHAGYIEDWEVSCRCAVIQPPTLGCVTLAVLVLFCRA